MNRIQSLLRTMVGAAASVLAGTLANAQQPPVPSDDGQEILDIVSDVRRRGCGGSPGTDSPLRLEPALADAAARMARGETSMQAAAKSGWRATRIHQLALRGYDNPRRMANALALRYCAALTNPQFTGLGWHREGNAWWVVLAARFTPPRPADAGAVATDVLSLTNTARTQRRQCGDRWFEPAPPLRYSAALERAALAHANDMARHGYLEHTGRDGSSAGERATRAGYAWRGIGENIASGQTSAQEVVRDWLRSPSHCSAMMNASFTDMGVAFAVDQHSESGIYWAQEFGRPR